MKNVIFPKVTVSSWSVSGNQLILPVTGENLSDINSLVQELEQDPIVDYCNVMTAVTDSNSTDENGNPGFTGYSYRTDYCLSAGSVVGGERRWK